jgi:ferredoxin--NADP+ reductase
LSHFNSETVVNVHHWTDRLFSFRTSRNPGFRFASGQFTMLGVEVEGRPLMRAYSLASAHYEDELEFFSIKVADGPLTSRLQHLREGDKVLVSRKATGTLVLDNLKPGRNLYLLGTGTGLAPFLSLVRDPETYERFERVVVVHGCRWIRELAYGELFEKSLPENQLIGETVKRQLSYYPSVTREPYRNTGRISHLLESGKLFLDLDLPPLEAGRDRAMLCGSPAMLSDLKAILIQSGFHEGNHGKPGGFVVEKAFVES